MSLAKAVGSGTSMLLVDKYGRKVLLFVSEVLVCATLFPLGTYFYMQENSCLAEEYVGTVSRKRKKKDGV